MLRCLLWAIAAAVRPRVLLIARIIFASASSCRSSRAGSHDRAYAPELWTLIRRMTIESQLWGQRRIQAELTRLGFKVSVRTVAKTALSLPWPSDVYYSSRQNNMMEDGVPAVIVLPHSDCCGCCCRPVPGTFHIRLSPARTSSSALSAEKSSRSISLKAAMCSMLRRSISPVLRTPKSCFASRSSLQTFAARSLGSRAGSMQLRWMNRNV
jgi:hypothetical protein